MPREARPARRHETPERRAEILDAAIAVLAEHGWRDATMLRVAQRARASKETLYAWFGDKRGLFAAVIAANAAGLAQALEPPASRATPTPARRVALLAEALLALLLGERALVLNRAAIAEAQSDPTFARLLAAQGRDQFAPRIGALLGDLRAEGAIAFAREEEAVEAFLGLVLGDLPQRRLLGLLPEPSTEENALRAARAAKRFLAAFAPR